MADLKGRIAVVTGASRGIGKGIALALGEAGATVYVTGRTVRPESGPPLLGKPLPGTVQETAEEVSARGGKGIAAPCDHLADSDVEALFDRVRREQGRLDILVNNAYSVPESLLSGRPFWELPIDAWDEVFDVGLRSHFVASVHAVGIMIPQGSGFIANISSSGAAGYRWSVAYGVEKAAQDRLTADMAHELREHNVAVVSVWPGLVRTERTMRVMEGQPHVDLVARLGASVSPEFVGRAVVALASDPKIMERSGSVVQAAELAREYRFTDVDGRQPPLG